MIIAFESIRNLDLLIEIFLIKSKLLQSKIFVNID